MTRSSCRAGLIAAVVTVTTGLASPAGTAQAAPGFLCPRIAAVCGFTEPYGRGDLVLIIDDEPTLDRPLRSAVNNTPDFWCVYSKPWFGGHRRELLGGETVQDFGFPVRAARHGTCEWR